VALAQDDRVIMQYREFGLHPSPPLFGTCNSAASPFEILWENGTAQKLNTEAPVKRVLQANADEVASIGKTVQPKPTLPVGNTGLRLRGVVLLAFTVESPSGAPESSSRRIVRTEQGLFYDLPAESLDVVA